MPNNLNNLRPYEVISVTYQKHVANGFMKRYIVASISPSKAAQSIQLEEGEQVLSSKELRDYQFVLGEQNA